MVEHTVQFFQSTPEKATVGRFFLAKANYIFKKVGQMTTTPNSHVRLPSCEKVLHSVFLTKPSDDNWEVPYIALLHSGASSLMSRPGQVGNRIRMNFGRS